MGEIGRRLVHAAGVLFPALYVVELFSWDALRVLLVGGSIVAILLEVLRLRAGLDWWIYRKLTRPYEQTSVAGYALYMFSITAVALVFNPAVAIPAMLMLMLGDPVSGYLGSGEPRRIKRPRALAAMFVVSLVVIMPFALVVLPNWMWALLAGVLAAVPATLADGVTVRIRGRIVDDNLSIPVVGAVALWIAYAILPI